jgi:phosphomannomutase
MKKKLLLFDVDGTICDSGKKITSHMAKSISNLVKSGCVIGIVGGGAFGKILYQLDDKIVPEFIFSECGSVYHKFNTKKSQYELINCNNLRLEPEYKQINQLVKTCLRYISEMEYLVSGNFIDLRNGLIYVSLVGMVATDEERANFIQLDFINGYRKELINILISQAYELGIRDKIDICLGGSVGIAIYPAKWNKVQVLDWINCGEYDSVYYFGDKYLLDGNDYELINHPNIVGCPVDSLEQTTNILNELYNQFTKN